MSQSGEEKNSGYNREEGRQALSQLGDGVELRHVYRRGEDSGKKVSAVIRDGNVVYNEKENSPSGAAYEANIDVTGSEYEINGWRWWEYYDDEEDEWKKLRTIR